MCLGFLYRFCPKHFSFKYEFSEINVRSLFILVINQVGVMIPEAV